MKNIFQHRFAFIGLFVALCAISFSSCSDDESYDFPGNSGKVYVRMQSSNLVNSVANVLDMKVSKTKFGIFGGGTVSFPVRSTVPVKSETSVTLGIDNSLIDVYNAKNGTECKALDASIFTLSEQNLVIGNGQMRSEKELEIAIEPAKINSLELGDYLVPVRLMDVTGAMEVSAEWSVIYLHVSVVDDPYGIPMADRSDWEVVDFSSQEVNGENAPASNALDGNYGSFWHTEWYYNAPNPPHHITIDMGAVKRMAGFQYVTRNGGRGCPAELVVEISTDNVTWNEVGNYGQSDLVFGSNAECKKFFDDLKDARYFRLTINKAGEEYWGSIYYSHYACLAEINAYIIE